MTTLFYEGDSVTYTGVNYPPRQGKLLYFASERAAHVKWTEGSRLGEIDLVDLYDLAPVTSSAQLAKIDPVGHTVLARAMQQEGATGVLNFLVTAKQLDGWRKIAADTVAFIESRLRLDASMEMVYEQLGPAETDQVISLAARTLIRDMVGEDVA